MESQQFQRAAKKLPTKIVDQTNDQRGQKKKPVNITYGQLKYGNFPDKTKKLILRTFFGNPEAEVFCIKFDQDDQHVASGNSDGSIKIFNIQNGKLIQNLQGSTGSMQTPTTCLRWHPNKQNNQLLLSGNADGSILLWNAVKGKQHHRLIEKNSIFSLDYSADGTKYATGGKDFHVRVYDDETQQQVIDLPPQEYNWPGHANRVFAIKFLQEKSLSNVFLTGGWDSMIRFWDVREQKSIGSIMGPNLSGDSIDYKNNQVLTASYRNTEQIQLWDFKEKKLIQEIDWIPEKKCDQVYCYCSQFCKTNNQTLMVGGTGINEVQVFNVFNSYKPCAAVIDMTQGIYALDYGNCTNKLAFGGGEGVVYIMSLQDAQD